MPSSSSPSSLASQWLQWLAILLLLLLFGSFSFLFCRLYCYCQCSWSMVQLSRKLTVSLLSLFFWFLVLLSFQTDVPQLTLALGASINRDSIKEGSDVYLECHVRANPWVYEVTWLFEGNILSSDHANGIIIANQSLVLQKVKRNMRGKYQCTGRNQQSLGKSNPFFLRVQCKYISIYCIRSAALPTKRS